MTIYVLVDCNAIIKAFTKRDSALKAMDDLMFQKCKKGFQILSTGSTEYTYATKDTKSRLYVTETNLQE